MTLTRRDLVLTLLGAGMAVAGGGLIEWVGGASPIRGGGDVRAFGARGDGRHDDAPALQRAIDSPADDLWFPAGQYRLGAPLRPRSGQSWRGDGAAGSVLLFGGSPRTVPFNLLHAESIDLTDFSLRDIGFRGGRGQQLVPSSSGQDGFAIYLRGSLRAISLRNCRFEQFGDGRGGGGGVVLGATPGQTLQGLSDIVVEECSFADNGNVPGVYISAGDRADCERSGVRLQGNSFAGSVGSTKFQNAVYVLGGGPQAPIRQVDISHNRFSFSTAVDAAIELNWVETFSISANTMSFQATMPGSTGILMRDGCAHGTIIGNVITSATADASLRGILALNFSHPGRISDVVIADNVISGISGAIAADRGSVGIVIVNNRILGTDADGSFGIHVIDAEGVLVSANMISAMKQAIVLGHGDQPASLVRDVVVERNRLRRCGGNGLALIAAVHPVSEWHASNLVFRDNSAIDTLSDSPLIDPALLSGGSL